MKALSKSLVALSMSIAALTSTVAMAEGGKCSADFGKISVVGEGQVKAMPDRASLNYRVSAIKDTAEAARVEVEKTVTAFSKAVDTLKLPEKSFIADNINIMPRYEWNESQKKQELKGYEASRSVMVKLTDFALIGKVSDMALKAGINQIAGFEYTVSDKKKYEYEAAKLAMEDAKERANILAQGFGVKVGSPCSLNFQDRSYIVGYRAPRMMAMSANAAVDAPESTYTIEPATISSKVEATFTINDK